MLGFGGVSVVPDGLVIAGACVTGGFGVEFQSQTGTKQQKSFVSRTILHWAGAAGYVGHLKRLDVTSY